MSARKLQHILVAATILMCGTAFGQFGPLRQLTV